MLFTLLFAFTPNNVFVGAQLHTHNIRLFNMTEMVTVTIKCSILMLHNYNSLRYLIWVSGKVSRPRRVEVIKPVSNCTRMTVMIYTPHQTLMR